MPTSGWWWRVVVPSLVVSVNEPGVKNGGSTSTRARVPTTAARLGCPATSELASSECPPCSCVISTEVCPSTPVPVGVLTAVTDVGGPRNMQANDIGYTPRSSSAPPPSSADSSREPGSWGKRVPKSAVTASNSPSAPSATSVRRAAT